MELWLRSWAGQAAHQKQSQVPRIQWVSARLLAYCADILTIVRDQIVGTDTRKVEQLTETRRQRFIPGLPLQTASEEPNCQCVDGVRNAVAPTVGFSTRQIVSTLPSPIAQRHRTMMPKLSLWAVSNEP